MNPESIPQWVSVGLTIIVLIIQISFRYSRDKEGSKEGLNHLQIMFQEKLHELQLDLAKLPDQVLDKVGKHYVTLEKYLAELKSLTDRVQALEDERRD